MPHVTGFGKVSPATGGKMPPPVIQRPMGGLMVTGNQSQQIQQPSVANMGNTNVSGNLMSMEQWGNRFPSTSVGQGGGQILRPNNPMQMMQPNQMPQQVSHVNGNIIENVNYNSKKFSREL